MNIIQFAKYKITSAFQEDRGSYKHGGIDFATPLGTNVQSTTSGTVIFTGYEGKGFGNYVKIQDGSGNIHYYGHLSSIDVKTGDSVIAGQHIASSGNTGKSTGPHLHYEVRTGSGQKLNGLNFLGMEAGSLPGKLTPPTNAENTSAVVETGSTTNKIIVNVLTFITLLVFGFFAFVFLTKTFKGGN